MFATSESSIGNLKSAVGSAAYFVITGKRVVQSHESPRRLWFCRKVSDNGAIDPTFLLSAYILEMDWDPGKVYIVPTYSLSDEWWIAFKGIANLGGVQGANLQLENWANAAPEGEFGQVIEVKLAPAQADPTITNSPDKVIDDLFAPLGPTPPGKIRYHGTHTIPRLYMMAAVVMEKKLGASVLALITNRNGAIVAFDCKWFNEGGCGHAEVKTLFKLKGQLPDGGAVFSTLKPCTMCAGLLNALDPQGRLRKYWVRDDAGNAADWYKGMGLKSLPNAQPLDKHCNNAKYLKLPGGESFLEKFNALRNRTEGIEDEKNKWFQEWLGKYQLPKDVFPIVDGNLVQGAKGRGNAIGKAKQGVKTLNEFCLRLGRPSQSPGKHDGLKKADTDSMKTSLAKHIKDSFLAAYPERIIDFIPGPASRRLGEAAHEALAAKLKKYGQWGPEWGEPDIYEGVLNPNVEKVLLYLRSFLAAAKVDLW